MEIKVWGNELKGAIEKAEKVMAKKADVEILENVLLTAYDDKITLTANNLMSCISININGNVIEPGAATLHKSDLRLIKRCEGELSITEENKTVTVAGIRKLEFIQDHEADDFPESMQVIDGNKAFTINAEEFKSALKIKKMASKEDVRPQLNSLNIRGNRIMALDGYRLGLINLNIDNKHNGDLMIPLDTIEQLDKIITKRDRYNLEFTYNLKSADDNQILFLSITGDDWTLTTRVKDGEYLNIDGVIPKEHAITINIRTKPLIETLKFFKDVKQGKKDIMTIDVTPHNMIFSKQNDKQKVSEIFEAGIHIESSIVGYKIGCNDRYLQELLETIDAEEVIINFGERNVNPITIINHDQSELYLVLPVRIAEDA
jgi:DNA polymerase-3 subunit beta